MIDQTRDISASSGKGLFGPAAVAALTLLITLGLLWACAIPSFAWDSDEQDRDLPDTLNDQRPAIVWTFPVELTVGDSVKTYDVTGGTVRDLLKLARVDWDEDDLISAPLDSELVDIEWVTVQKVDYEYRTVEEIVPSRALEVPTSLLADGQSLFLHNGKDGERIATYATMWIDGEPQEEYLAAEEILTPVLHQITLVGKQSAPISPYNFACEMDEDGVPVSYNRVLTGQKATAYYAPAGAKTSTGVLAAPGNVAVNPKNIPYGTKMYIRSADGRFVYGYAVAADTGGAMRSNRVAVDLYFNTLQECTLYGVGLVDIYILE